MTAFYPPGKQTVSSTSTATMAMDPIKLSPNFHSRFIPDTLSPRLTLRHYARTATL
jgi:hypothetical protein